MHGEAESKVVISTTTCFYLSKGVPVNLRHLNARLVDSGFEGARDDLTLDEIKQILCKRFEGIYYSQAKADVVPFIHSTAALDIWSAEFFQSITGNLYQTGLLLTRRHGGFFW